jgi:aspartate racemase
LKRIGVIGGLSAESTQLFYKYLIDEYRKIKGDECYPEIIIYSVTFCEFSKYMKEDRTKAKEILEKALKGLEKAGAELVVIAANTPHMFFDELAKEAKVLMISIIDALAEELKKNNVNRVGLLGTKATLTEGFYVEKLKSHGIEVIVPEMEDVERINDIIMNELVRGVAREESKKYVINVARSLIKKGAQGIALSCTELPMLFSDVKEFRIFDTTRILARKAIEVALS